MRLTQILTVFYFVQLSACVFEPDGNHGARDAPIVDAPQRSIDATSISPMPPAAECACTVAGPETYQMNLPFSRNTTYVAGISQVKSADLNDLQDQLIANVGDVITGLGGAAPDTFSDVLTPRLLDLDLLTTDLGGTAPAGLRTALMGRIDQLDALVTAIGPQAWNLAAGLINIGSWTSTNLTYTTSTNVGAQLSSIISFPYARGLVLTNLTCRVIEANATSRITMKIRFEAADGSGSGDLASIQSNGTGTAQSLTLPGPFQAAEPGMYLVSFEATSGGASLRTIRQLVSGTVSLP